LSTLQIFLVQVETANHVNVFPDLGADATSDELLEHGEGEHVVRQADEDII